MAFDLFLSAASNDFGDLRETIESYLERAGASSLIQEKFPQTSTDTLVKLNDLMVPCKAVIHFAGSDPGSRPEVQEIVSLVTHLQENGQSLLRDLADLDAAMARPGVLETLTYTQWEAVLALHHNIPLFVYATREGAVTQSDHLERLKLAPAPRFAEVTTNPVDFVGKVMADLHRILEDSPTRVPRNLPDSIGAHFAGRLAQMATIENHLTNGDSRGVAVTQAISGLGGVGKTRLALEFAHRHADRYSALLFCRADSLQNFFTGLADLAGPAVLDLPEKMGDLDTRLTAVVNWLKDHSGWFLLLDNVDDKISAEAVQNLLNQDLPGHVLITSRLAHWSPSVQQIDLDVLPPNEARDLLLQSSGFPEPESGEEQAALAALAGVCPVQSGSVQGTPGENDGLLGGLAIALEQAGAYMKVKNIRFAEYRHRIEDQRSGTDPLDPRLTHYPESVRTTWLTTCKELGEPARACLRELSCWAVAPIPRAAVADQEDAFVELSNFSLVKLSFEPFDCLIVHRLVLEIAESLIAEEAKPAVWDRHLERLMQWVPEGGRAPETWAKWEQFQPHAEKWQKHLRQVPEEAVILNGYAEYEFCRNADFRKAEPMLRRALAIFQSSLGLEHPQTQTTVRNLEQMSEVMQVPTEA